MLHFFLQRTDLLFVDEHFELARPLEIDHGHKKGRAADALLLFCCQPGHCRRQQGAAEAVTNDIALFLARDVFDQIKRRQRTFGQIVVETFVREFAVGIDPGHDKHRVPLLHRPAHEGIVFAQVEDVELVDPRRNDQQGRRMYLVGQRRILDQLHDVVLEHHLALARADVLAEPECLGVGHAHTQLAAVAARQIFQQVVQPLHQVLPARIDGFAQHFRIGQHEIRRRQRINVLAGIKIDFFRSLFIQPGDAAQ